MRPAFSGGIGSVTSIQRFSPGAIAGSVRMFFSCRPAPPTTRTIIFGIFGVFGSSRGTSRPRSMSRVTSAALCAMK